MKKIIMTRGTWGLVALSLTTLGSAQTQVFANRFNLGGPGREAPFGIVRDASNNVYVAATIWTGTSTVPNNSAKVWVARYTAAGALSWQRTIQNADGTPICGHGFAIDSQGNLGVLVEGISGLVTNINQSLLKLQGTTGSTMWTTNVSTTAGMFAQHLRARGTDFYVGGSGANATGIPGYVAAKYTGAAGAMAWRGIAVNGTNRFTVPRAMAVDGTGAVLMTGMSNTLECTAPQTQKAFTAKFNASTGAPAWVKAFSVANTGDEGVWIAATTANDAVIMVNSPDPANTQPRVTVARLASATGNTAASRSFVYQDGAIGMPTTGVQFALAPNNDVILTGTTTTSFMPGAFVAKMPAALNATTWSKGFLNGSFQSGDADIFRIAFDTAANPMIGLDEAIFSATSLSYKAWSLKLNTTTGATLFTNKYIYTSGQAYHRGILADTTGLPIVLHEGFNATARKAVTRKLTATAVQTWIQLSAQAASVAEADFPTGMSAGPTNSTYVVGGSGGRATIRRVGSTGTQAWFKTYQAAASGPFDFVTPLDGALAVATTPTGDAVVLIFSRGKLILQKYAAATGAVLWTRELDGSPAFVNLGIAATRRQLAVDAAGNVFAITNRENLGVTKVNGATGAILWTKDQTGVPAGQSSYGNALILDTVGNVYVTGSQGVTSDACPPVDNYTFVTVRFAASNGTQNWLRTYKGSVNGENEAVDIVIDSTGAIWVAGTSASTATRSDIALQKINGTTGAQITAVRYLLTGALDHMALALQINASNQPYVLGRAMNASGLEHVVVRYNATGGAPNWVNRTNNAFNNLNFMNQLALDAAGNAYVAGSTQGATGNVDFLVYRLAAANGARNATVTYNGSGAGFDTAIDVYVEPTTNHFLAVGPSVGATTNIDQALVRWRP